jgi:diphthamide synthase (EF-2-diphthine--ammonia ligase)
MWIISQYNFLNKVFTGGGFQILISDMSAIKVNTEWTDENITTSALKNTKKLEPCKPSDFQY